MARYRFQLESLQKFREAHRDQMRARLAEAIYAQTVLEEQTKAITREINEIAISQRATLQSDNVNINALVDRQRYELILKAQITTIQNQGETLTIETERRRTALAEADQQVRVLEKLDDRRREEHRQSEAKKEDERLNEISMQQFLRKNREAIT